MLTVAKLLEAIDGLDLDAPVVVGIIDGARFNAAYANQQVSNDLPVFYICCYEEPRAWEGQQPTPSGDGTQTLAYDPENPNLVPSDPEVARRGARADQLRAGTREVLLGLDAEARAELVSTCAGGNLTKFDERAQQLVGNLALIAMLDMGEPLPDGGAE